jgi:hypothetical protein
MMMMVMMMMIMMMMVMMMMMIRMHDAGYRSLSALVFPKKTSCVITSPCGVSLRRGPAYCRRRRFKNTNTCPIEKE